MTVQSLTKKLLIAAAITGGLALSPVLSSPSMASQNHGASGIDLREAPGSRGFILALHADETAEGLAIDVRVPRGLRRRGHLDGTRLVKALATDAQGAALAETMIEVSKRDTYVTLTFAGLEPSTVSAVTVSVER